jgi:hypothetical protein
MGAFAKRSALTAMLNNILGGTLFRLGLEISESRHTVQFIEDTMDSGRIKIQVNDGRVCFQNSQRSSTLPFANLLQLSSIQND